MTIDKITNLPFWQSVYLGNSLGEYALASVLLLGLLLAFKIFQAIILLRLNKLAQKTKTDIDDVFIEIVRSVRPPFYAFLALYISIGTLEFSKLATKAVGVALLVWVVYQATVALQLFINHLINKRSKEEGSDGSKSALKVMGGLIKGLIWAVGALFILSNLGVNITSVIAGLGVGGIAIAFALQNILGDLFSSFALYFDKPFVPGDFIIIGEHMGVVKKIGIKTTRIQSLSGEEIVVSNQELTSTRGRNYKKMEERRVAFNFGVVYQTPVEKLAKADDLVRKAVESAENTRFDRVHFKSFDDSALAFEAVYYVLSPDYNLYMDIQQQINFKIKAAFEQEDIEMAYPTRTLYIAK